MSHLCSYSTKTRGEHAFDTEIQFTQAHFDRLAAVLKPDEDATLITDFTLKRDLMFAVETFRAGDTVTFQGDVAGRGV